MDGLPGPTDDYQNQKPYWILLRQIRPFFLQVMNVPNRMESLALPLTLFGLVMLHKLWQGPLQSGCKALKVSEQKDLGRSLRKNASRFADPGC